jgi:hypothetical protein
MSKFADNHQECQNSKTTNMIMTKVMMISVTSDRFIPSLGCPLVPDNWGSLP